MTAWHWRKDAAALRGEPQPGTASARRGGEYSGDRQRGGDGPPNQPPARRLWLGLPRLDIFDVAHVDAEPLGHLDGGSDAVLEERHRATHVRADQPQRAATLAARELLHRSHRSWVDDWPLERHVRLDRLRPRLRHGVPRLKHGRREGLPQLLVDRVHPDGHRSGAPRRRDDEIEGRPVAPAGGHERRVRVQQHAEPLAAERPQRVVHLAIRTLARLGRRPQQPARGAHLRGDDHLVKRLAVRRRSVGASAAAPLDVWPSARLRGAHLPHGGARHAARHRLRQLRHRLAGALVRAALRAREAVLACKVVDDECRRVGADRRIAAGADDGEHRVEQVRPKGLRVAVCR
mmetsp:Transcript_38221/g.117418  ORF Transcript_38221/g.117418 Transcript_38221/m.117418 type:complete len:347 (+) Transcript_38221:415-1455(+)